MGLGWRDGAATVLIAAAAAMTLSVANDWNWLSIGEASDGGLLVLGLGLCACAVGGGPLSIVSAMKWDELSSQEKMFISMASALAVLSTVLLLVAIAVSSIEVLVGATIALVAVWAVATIHHALVGMRPTGMPSGHALT